LLFFLLGFVSTNYEHTHPVYVAVAEINYDNTAAFATVLCKVYSDDMDLALRRAQRLPEDAPSPQNSSNFTDEMDRYIKDHFQLQINNVAQNMVFLNYHKEDNALLVNFRINKPGNVQTCEITDNIFYELYEKQIQIVYVTVNGNRKNGRLQNPNTRLSFAF
jgi:hypothetical protein